MYLLFREPQEQAIGIMNQYAVPIQDITCSSLALETFGYRFHNFTLIGTVNSLHDVPKDTVVCAYNLETLAWEEFVRIGEK